MNSHIIPEFIYSSLYDASHRFHVLATPGVKSRRYLHKGIYERLLCIDCEQKISRFEGYAKQWLSGERQEIRTNVEGKLIQVEGIDYKNFRLFGLSILWRAGVSNHRMFHAVDLGEYSEHLRRMLINEDPGKPDEFGFLLTVILWEGRQINDLIMDPSPSVLFDVPCYLFIFGGLVWVYTISSTFPQSEIGQCFVKPSGQMMLLAEEIQNMKFLWEAIKDMMKNPRNTQDMLANEVPRNISKLV